VVVITPLIHGEDVALTGILSRLVAIGLAVAAGLWLRARADFIAGVRDRATRVERERELLAGQAVAAERVRIARELHDVVAHNVSLMVVQAQALAATDATTGEAERKEALGRVAGLGREALSEMHRMLGVLRLDTSEAAEREPQPGLGEVETLVARARQTGLEAELHREGHARELPPGVELSAYRIVQEALTNVIRHAHASRVTVTLADTSAGLEVVVTDDGLGPPPGTNGAGEGHGLVGMRERVALFGGDLRTGAMPGGRGYRVHARLPV
jgi:signal transduction histidine kinase